MSLSSSRTRRDVVAAAPKPERHVLRALAVVLGASLLLGGLTSFAQTVLPDPLRPAANSVSGWVVLTVLLVWLVRQSTAFSAVLGAVSFVSLVLGYQVVSTLRGFPTSETLFLIAGVRPPAAGRRQQPTG